MVLFIKAKARAKEAEAEGKVAKAKAGKAKAKAAKGARQLTSSRHHAGPDPYPGKAGIRGTAPEPEWGPSGEKKAI